MLACVAFWPSKKIIKYVYKNKMLWGKKKILIKIEEGKSLTRYFLLQLQFLGRCLFFLNIESTIVESLKSHRQSMTFI